MKHWRGKYAIENPSKYKMFESVSFIRRGTTTTRSVMHYLKMKRGVPSSAVQVKCVFPRSFRSPVAAKNILKTLEGRGFAKQTYYEAWVITPMGIEAVALLAQRDRQLYCESL